MGNLVGDVFIGNIPVSKKLVLDVFYIACVYSDILLALNITGTVEKSIFCIQSKVSCCTYYGALLIITIIPVVDIICAYLTAAAYSNQSVLINKILVRSFFEVSGYKNAAQALVGKAACRNIRIFSNTYIATVFVGKAADFGCQIALYVHGRSGIQHIICYDVTAITCMDAAHILIDKAASSNLAVAVKIDICCSIGYGAFSIQLQILTCHEGSIGISNIHTTYLHGLACKHGGFIVF